MKKKYQLYKGKNNDKYKSQKAISFCKIYIIKFFYVVIIVIITEYYI